MSLSEEFRPPSASGAPDPRGWFERVAHLSVDLVTIFDEERLLQKVMETFVEAARAAKGSLMLLDKTGERLEIRASLGVSEEARRRVRPRVGEGAAGRVFETGRPVLIRENSPERALYVAFYGPERAVPKMTLLSLPLIYRGEVMAVINLDRRGSGEPFGADDIALLSVLCNYAAVALANLRFYRESVTDGLTGLIAQKTFHIRLRQEFDRARRYRTFLALLFLDLDHFKAFNDTHGHPLGDQALRHLAGLLRETTRSIDVVGRCGGEEFGVLLLETDLPSARQVAERVRGRVARAPLVAGGVPYPLTVSIGAAAFSPADAVLTPEELLRRADKALYRAKTGGRNQVSVWQVEGSAGTGKAG